MWSEGEEREGARVLTEECQRRGPGYFSLLPLSHPHLRAWS